MPTGWSTFPVEFQGGLVSNLSPLQQGINLPGSATFLQNFEPSKEGGYRKVRGYTKYIAGAVTGTGPILGVKIANSDKVIAVRENLTGDSQYWINVGAAWSSLGTAANLGGRVRGVSFNFSGTHKIFFVDGLNTPAVFEDATDTLSFPTLPSDIVGASQAAVFKNHIFAAKGTNLAFSAPFNEADWSVANGGGIINISHEITGLIPFREQLIVFSRNKIQRITGSSVSDFQLLPITDDIGCPYPDTIQEVGGDVMFMGPDGFRLLSATERIGDFGLGLASDPINKDALSFINSTETFASIVLREKAQYRIFGYISAVNEANSKGLVATKFSDQGNGSIQWGTLSGFRAYCADGRYTPDREQTVFANEDGYVYLLESSSARDGQNISAIYQSPFLPITDPQKRKTLYKVALYTDIQGVFSVNLSIRFDTYRINNYNERVQAPMVTLSSDGAGVFTYGSVGAIYGTATYGSELDKIYETNLIGSGKTFSFRVEDDSTNPAFSLDTAIFEYREHDRQ